MAAIPRPFVFDTVFDGERVVAPARVRADYTADDLAAAREEGRIQGRAEGERSAVARAEAQVAAAMDEAVGLIRAGLSALQTVAHEHRTASAELAAACGHAVAGAALDMFPEAPAVAALEALAREIEAQPRLVVRADAYVAQRLAKSLEEAADHAGFAGQVVVKADPSFPPAAFQFDWGEGRATFDPGAAQSRVLHALSDALAAEGLHAEPPPLDLSPETRR